MHVTLEKEPQCGGWTMLQDGKTLVNEEGTWMAHWDHGEAIPNDKEWGCGQSTIMGTLQTLSPSNHKQSLQNIGPSLDEEERQKLSALLKCYHEVFTLNPNELWES